MCLLIGSNFQNEILGHQIDWVAHLDQLLVLIDRFFFGADNAPNHSDQVGAVFGRLQITLRPFEVE